MDTKLKRLALAHNLKLGMIAPTLRRLDADSVDIERRLAICQTVETVLWVNDLTRHGFLERDAGYKLATDLQSLDIAEIKDFFGKFGWTFPQTASVIVESFISRDTPVYPHHEQEVDWTPLELTLVIACRLAQSDELGEFVAPLFFADDPFWNSLPLDDVSIASVHAATIGANSIWRDGHRALVYRGFFEFCSTMEAFLDQLRWLHEVGTERAAGASSTLKQFSGWRFSMRSQAAKRRFIQMATNVDGVVCRYLLQTIPSIGKKKAFALYCRDLLSRAENEFGRAAASGASARA